MKLWLILGVLCLTAAQAAAQDGRRMLTEDEARAWTAVGRVNIADAGHCTGALIEPDIVLTAAHCVFHPTSRRQVSANRIHFVAGWRLGEYVAHRTVARVIVHRDYAFTGEPTSDAIRSDVALLVLHEEISRDVARPFERVRTPRVGQRLSIVSYGRDRPEAPSIEDQCSADVIQDNILVMNCDVTFGVSGSPIFTLEGGEARVASVVSAMGQYGGNDAAFGMTLDDGTLQNLLLEARRSGAEFEAAPAGQSIREQLGRREVAPLFRPAQ
ncbi:MAG: trypsin-like serine protease [Pseudomonadota bacterium]